MLLIPAIDLKDGQCVRLKQGVMSDATVFSDDPVKVALHWRDQGARRLHLVDLNGAFAGKPKNLAVIRDAAPGKQLAYRVVDNGRVRDYQYVVSPEPETVAVEDLSYSALRVSRSNGGNDETIFWVADGVPTPVRILQREDGQDGVDLRLVEYQGVP